MPRRDFAAFHPSLTDDDVRELVAPFMLESINRESCIALFICDTYEDATGVRAKFERQRDEYEKSVREDADAESQKRYEEYLKRLDLNGPLEIPATAILADGRKEQTIYVVKS